MIIPNTIFGIPIASSAASIAGDNILARPTTVTKLKNKNPTLIAVVSALSL